MHIVFFNRRPMFATKKKQKKPISWPPYASQSPLYFFSSSESILPYSSFLNNSFFFLTALPFWKGWIIFLAENLGHTLSFKEAHDHFIAIGILHFNMNSSSYSATGLQPMLRTVRVGQHQKCDVEQFVVILQSVFLFFLAAPNF